MNGDLTDGSIILMHDIHEPSVQAALQIIPQLVEKGYKLMTVSELAKAKGVELQNASYADFWDSSLSKGLVAGYDGPLLSARLLQKAGTEAIYLTAAVRMVLMKEAICQMEAAKTVPVRTIQTEVEMRPMTMNIMMTAAEKNTINSEWLMCEKLIKHTYRVL